MKGIYLLYRKGTSSLCNTKMFDNILLCNSDWVIRNFKSNLLHFFLSSFREMFEFPIVINLSFSEYYERIVKFIYLSFDFKTIGYIFLVYITIQIGFYFMHSNKLGNNSLLGKVGRRISSDTSKLCKWKLVVHF